jgi:hypothetical protein
MIVGWAVLVYALAYVGFLFAIAWYGDRVASRRGQPAAWSRFRLETVHKHRRPI